MGAPVRDIAIDEMLGSLGLTDRAAREAGRAAIEAAGLTRPGKTRIAAEKRAAVAAAVRDGLALACTSERCRQLAATAHPGVALIAVPAEACPICGGSANRRAVGELAEACGRAGVARVLVVGGSPDIRRELAATVGDGVDLRLVDGTQRRTGRQAADDIRWAQVIVVCGATELDHKVSQLYTRDPAARGRVVVSNRRGVAAIADELRTHLGRRATSPRARAGEPLD